MDAEQKELIFQLKEEMEAIRKENKNLKEKLNQIETVTFYSDYGDGTAEDKLAGIRDILEEDD